MDIDTNTTFLATLNLRNHFRVTEIKKQETCPAIFFCQRIIESTDILRLLH